MSFALKWLGERYQVSLKRKRSNCLSAPSRRRLWVEALEERSLLASLHLSFDGSLSGTDQEVPLAHTGTSYESGLVDQAVHIGDPGYVRYSTDDNVSASQGTVQFWIKPDWSGYENTTHVFFEVGDNFNNGMLLSIDGANNLRFIQWGDDPDSPAVETSVERGVATSGAHWVAGQWHYVAATWNGAEQMASFYIDGEPVGSIENAPFIDAFSTSYLSIGAETNAAQPAMAAFDEFRIDSRALMSGEIRQQYYAGLGIDVLGHPMGLTVDSAGRTIVAESATAKASVFDADGGFVGSFGSYGSSDGQFDSPWDIAADDADRIHVLDKGNHRVQTFEANGTYLSQFGVFGTGPGQFSAPEGIFVDRSSQMIYVADTGNHRVQRLSVDGTPDPSFGFGGVIGVTGQVRRDHTGFDRPTDVAVHPATGDVYVADFGNHRLEVFDSSGNYLRSYLAVYRPHGLAFDALGNLLIAGEDPNNGYTAYDGRLRFFENGKELIGAHYTGGIDDLSRMQGGVAVRPDGRIVFTDTLNGRIVQTDTQRTLPIRDLEIEARGTEVTFRWKTAQAGPSKVRLGSTLAYGTEVTDPSITLDHEITVQGLIPDTRLYYGVSFPDSFDGADRWTPDDLLNTGVAAGETPFLRLKVAGLIYTDTQPGIGYSPMDDAVLQAARSRLDTVAEFYWRNSGFRLWPDIEVVQVDRDIEGDFSVWSAAEADLSAMGYSAADDLDAAWSASVLYGGNFGGGGTLFDRPVGMCQWVSQSDFVAIHETSHSVDSIYALNGLAKYEFNHGIWAVPGEVGHDFSVNAQIIGNMLPVNYTATRAPFDKVMVAPDADQDGVPDSSPNDLSRPLAITESSLGSSTLLEDTDGDGLDDLREATELACCSLDLTRVDTDGDGIPDAEDDNPAYAVGNTVAHGSPVVDGVIDDNESWTVLTDRWGFSNDRLVDDNNLYQDQVTTYAAWDDDYLYLALDGPPSTTRIQLDGSADNWFMGPDNYWLEVSNANPNLGVRINVGVPDIFRQIDDDGQFSEFFDTDPKFTKPYGGRPFFDQADEGLGFPGRQVVENDLTYAQDGAGDRWAWEVAIPWSDATLLAGYHEKEMAIAFDVSGDKLFSTDHAARFTLIAWQNPIDQYDVTDDGLVLPNDLLELITYINASAGDPSLPAPPNVPPSFYDVNGDGFCTAEDLLMLVNHINRLAAVPGEGEDTTPTTISAYPAHGASRIDRISLTRAAARSSTEGGVRIATPDESPTARWLARPRWNHKSTNAVPTSLGERPRVVRACRVLQTNRFLHLEPAIVALESILPDLAEDLSGKMHDPF